MRKHLAPRRALRHHRGRLWHDPATCLRLIRTDVLHLVGRPRDRHQRARRRERWHGRSHRVDQPRQPQPDSKRHVAAVHVQLRLGPCHELHGRPTACSTARAARWSTFASATAAACRIPSACTSTRSSTPSGEIQSIWGTSTLCRWARRRRCSASRTSRARRRCTSHLAILCRQRL